MIGPRDVSMKEVLSKIPAEELKAIAKNPISEVALKALQKTGEWREVIGIDYGDIDDDDEIGHAVYIHVLRFRPEKNDIHVEVKTDEFHSEDPTLRLSDWGRIQDLAQEILREKPS